MTTLALALTAATRAACDAGRLLRDDFHRPTGPRGRGDHAEADVEAERLIRQILAKACPGWGFRGEETGYRPGREPLLWLVDPNDGTRTYLQGRRGSAVSVAAVRDGVPVLGVVFAFAYPDDAGDLFAWAEGQPLTHNGEPVPGLDRDAGLGPTAVVWLSQNADRVAAANAGQVAPARFLALPSIAYRLARVAAGEGVAAVSLSDPCGWDYAAGHALLCGAGGVLVDGAGREVRYENDGTSRVASGRCFGGSPAAVKALRGRDWDLVLAAPREPGWSQLVGGRPGRAVADPGRLARAQGCWLGQLAGDSLGSRVEFCSLAVIRARFPDGVRDLADGGHWNLLAGQPTDDSELASLLARALVRQGAYDAGAVLEAYLGWFQDPGTFDVGGTVRRALSAAVGGTTAEERLRLAGRYADPDRPTNGSLMRISPLGIFGAGRPGEAAGWARAESRLTHPSPLCQDACAVLVAAVATAVADGGGPEAAYAAALAEASGAGPEVRAALERAAHEPPRDYVTNMGFVFIALQNAFYQLLHAPSLEAGLIDTVSRGGDTDTNAAVAGSLLGAVHGRGAVPGRWVRAVLSCRPLPGTPTRHPRPMELWPVDALELAEALLLAGEAAPRAE